MKAVWVVGLLLVLRWGPRHGSAANAAAGAVAGRGAALAAATNSASTSTLHHLHVPITLIHTAAAKGAVCLDGTPPGYNLHPGSGSGQNSWLIDLEGGGWCNDVSSCLARKATRLGSSNYMKKRMLFAGILSDNPQVNPDFYNWNRIRVRYCDGASFAGEGHDKARGLYFRGQRIFSAAVEELMSKGMKSANKVLLTGCSAGALASILHCDKFRALFPANTTVKCLADAGLFLDVIDIAGRRTLRKFFQGVVNLQGVISSLPATCTTKMDPDLCFFPQNLLENIQTPTFLLNSAYDGWQLQESLAPKNADPAGHWTKCISNHSKCNAEQIEFLQGFRSQMLDTVKGFSTSNQNGLFITSCFAHCQSLRLKTWYGDNAAATDNKGIAKYVGDWYFGRAQVKEIDCPYPCDNTCR